MLRSPSLTPTGESPLTDPRSLVSSAVFHVLLVLLASLTALNVALPQAASRPKALYGEIDPVDNRADVPSAPGQGGGSPGDIGGMSSLPFTPASDGTQAGGATKDSAADMLLAEILPSSEPKPSESLPRALPGPQTIGQGLIPGSGAGVAEARAVVPAVVRAVASGRGPSSLAARDHAHSFAYVIDCSGSMATRNSLEVAKREMLASINQLPPDALFRCDFL